MEWYYANNNQRQGPVFQADFERLVREGVIHPDTLVWKQGMPNWIPYSQLPPADVVPPAPAGTPAAPEADDTAICAVSGKRYPKREMIQYEGQWVSAEHRDVFFQRLREGVAPSQHFQYGGFWIRFVAKFIDRIVLFAVGMGIGLALTATAVISTGHTNPQDPEFWRFFILQQGILGLVNLALGLLYHWFFIRKFDATPGKMALGLKVLRSDGSKLSTGRIIGRYFSEILSGMILCIGYIMAGFDEEKRALHDHMCDTRVVKAK